MRRIGCVIEDIENDAKCMRALAKCKRNEEKQLRDGYRWITVNHRTKVLVECDKKGKPTEKGQRQLDAVKSVTM